MLGNTWTEDDFGKMSWHDCKIYGIHFGPKDNEILFDIDYILQWISPAAGQTNYTFSVAPATLIFRNVYNVIFDFSSISDIRIDDLYKDNPVVPPNAGYIKEVFEYDWTITTNCGNIKFKSVGFKQVLRQPPVITTSQVADAAYRKGVQPWLT